MVVFLAVGPICLHLSLFVQIFLLFTMFVYLFWSNPRHLIPIWRVWQQPQYPLNAWRKIGFAMALQGQRPIHLDSTGQFGRDVWPCRVELGVGIQCAFRDFNTYIFQTKQQTIMITNAWVVALRAVIPVNLNLCFWGWSWIRSPVFRGADSHLLKVIVISECPWVHTKPTTA